MLGTIPIKPINIRLHGETKNKQVPQSKDSNIRTINLIIKSRILRTG